jgi:von Willebrand factor type A domain-containing protein
VETPAISEPIRTARAPDSTKRRRWWRTRSFLLISIGLHLLFGLGAAYVVVSRYSAARKLTFQAGPKSPNPAERALEHRVQLKEKTKSAPAAIPKRVISSAPSKVELPPMPSLAAPAEAPQAPIMAGAGQSADFGPRPGTMGSVGGTGSGAAINFFGIRDKSSSVVIMIDISDSMFTRTGDAEGRKLARHGAEQNFQTVRDEAIKLVQSLASNVQFGIVRWSGGAYSWKAELIPATEENKQAAVAHIQNDVDMKKAKAKKGEAGGTRHDLAIQEAFNLKPEVIYMLTDGNATAAQPGGGLSPIPPEDIFRVADVGQKTLGRRARLHVIYYLTGADNASERQMLMSLAARNGGKFLTVSAKGREG